MKAVLVLKDVIKSLSTGIRPNINMFTRVSDVCVAALSVVSHRQN